ncbi:pericentriolar material 1 protein-like, partial [Limulus polyphemus]|uniref:Pericentriolar material 1 protein-like n=1 Tax=Limulus polyphemus TaxID=6850 RepID=A0ABM1C391_LIMPO
KDASEGTVEQLESQVERIVLDLVPFLRHHLQQELTPQLQGQLCNRVLGTLQPAPSHPLARFFRNQLLQILQHTLARFSGKRICECEEELLMEVTEVVFKELAFHKLMATRKSKQSQDVGGCVE